MKFITFKMRICLALMLMTLRLIPIQAETESPMNNDTTETHLLNELRKAFNLNDEKQFYKCVQDYRQFYLNADNLPLYYQGWMHEVLYDVNHNHFYRAMRKTTTMRKDMETRQAESQYYLVTYIRGIIYSLRGNLTLAHQYFDRALNEVDHSQPNNLIAIYMDLANIEMDYQPEEAMKHLNCAIDIIKANGEDYEYSDAIGFKVIVAFAMRDWKILNNAYNEYMRLKEGPAENFSTTYYNYVNICKNAADHRYDEAISLTYQLTNTTDIYKLQTDIYELAGDTAKAYLAHKRYTAVKDSVNNVIMGEEMMGSANDLAQAEKVNEDCKENSERMRWIVIASVAAALLVPYAICRCHRRKYTKRLQQQNRELLIARDKAKEAERMKINFIQNMSHEVRTPLNIISGFAQVISDPDADLDDEKRNDIAQRISASANNIVSIFNEILDISGKESIHFLDKCDTVNCNEMARRILKPYQEEHGHRLDFHFETSLKDGMKIKTNESEAEKALSNLLSNACKFTEKGQVTLSCRLDEMESNLVCFAVSDTGVGIKESEQERVFEHFYKIDDYAEGVGLGLPLARRIARQLGGDVVLDTNYKEGSRFILKLPVT